LIQGLRKIFWALIPLQILNGVLRMDKLRKVYSDVLIIGSGAAGFAAAITAAEKTAKVVLTNKGVFGRTGSTCLASVTYAAALGHTDHLDSPEQHFNDTVVAGRYIGNQALVKILAEEAPRTVYDLERYGMRWYKRGEKRINPSVYNYLQIPAPPHTYSRGLYNNEKTGRVLQNALCKEVLKHSQDIQVINDIYIWMLVVEDKKVRGAIGLDLRTGGLVVFSCKAIVLATGGSGASYQVSSTDTGATGDGCSMALRAGAELIDMEFVQFFPTAFVHPESLRGILVSSSTLLPLGLKIYNKRNERFLKDQYPDRCENLPRDLLSQSIFREIRKGKGTLHGGVWMDSTDIANWEEVRRDKPRSFGWPERFGMDSSRFEVAPTCHFSIGGVKINGKGETNIAGLYAAGEIAGGVHGSNRIAGNALSECVVFGQLAGKEAAHFRKEARIEISNSYIRDEEKKLRSLFKISQKKTRASSSAFIQKLKELMYMYAGVVRDREGLEKAAEEIKRLKDIVSNDLTVIHDKVFNYDQIHAFELLNMIELSEVIVRSALKRKESRGAHYRKDYPETDNLNWLKNIVVQRKGHELLFRTENVSSPYMKLTNGDSNEK